MITCGHKTTTSHEATLRARSCFCPAVMHE
jgi:hypothetical protein